jgi:hypothetical protein
MIFIHRVIPVSLENFYSFDVNISSLSRTLIIQDWDSTNIFSGIPEFGSLCQLYISSWEMFNFVPSDLQMTTSSNKTSKKIHPLVEDFMIQKLDELAT